MRKTVSTDLWISGVATRPAYEKDGAHGKQLANLGP